MSRRFALAAFALFSVLVSQPLLAKDKGVYLGADYNYSNFDSNSNLLPENFSGYSPYVGYQFNKNFAVELGYFGTMEESEQSNVGAARTSVDTQYHSFYGDLVGLYPLNEQFSLLGAVGYERIYAEADARTTLGATTTSSSADNDVNAYRFGLGAKYNVTPEVAIRTMLRYVATDFSGVDNYIQGSLGLSYQF